MLLTKERCEAAPDAAEPPPPPPPQEESVGEAINIDKMDLTVTNKPPSIKSEKQKLRKPRLKHAFRRTRKPVEAFYRLTKEVFSLTLIRTYVADTHTSFVG